MTECSRFPRVPGANVAESSRVPKGARGLLEMTGTHSCCYSDDVWSTITGAIVNRTYGTLKNLCISLFLLSIFGPIYYGFPKY